MKLDTGAEVNVMPKRVYNQLTHSSKLEKTSVKLHGYGGHDIPVLGSTILTCKMNGIKEETKFFVVETKSRTTLGLKSCEDMKLIKIMDEVKEKSKILDTLVYNHLKEGCS